MRAPTTRVPRAKPCARRRCGIKQSLCTPNSLNRVVGVGSYVYRFKTVAQRRGGQRKVTVMGTTGRRLLLAAGVLAILAGSAPAFAQSHGGGHASGGGHSGGGGHAAGGHVGGGAHYAAAGHYGGGDAPRHGGGGHGRGGPCG